MTTIKKVKSSSVQIHPLVKNALTRMVGDMSSMTYVELVQHFQDGYIYFEKNQGFADLFGWAWYMQDELMEQQMGDLNPSIFWKYEREIRDLDIVREALCDAIPIESWSETMHRFLPMPRDDNNVVNSVCYSNYKKARYNPVDGKPQFITDEKMQSIIWDIEGKLLNSTWDSAKHNPTSDVKIEDIRITIKKKSYRHGDIVVKIKDVSTPYSIKDFGWTVKNMKWKTLQSIAKLTYEPQVQQQSNKKQAQRQKMSELTRTLRHTLNLNHIKSWFQHSNNIQLVTMRDAHGVQTRQAGGWKPLFKLVDEESIQDFKDLKPSKTLDYEDYESMVAKEEKILDIE